VLATFAHAVGWPMVRGGSQALADALAAELRDAGGEIVTGQRVGSLADLPPARAILLDVTPRQLVAIAGDRLGPVARRGARRYRYGPGVFKVDWALDGPVPWAAEAARRAGTLHLGGTLDEIAASEADVAAGRHPDRPYVLFVQYHPWDPSPRARGTHDGVGLLPRARRLTGRHDRRIEAQVERFAPGFRDRILARATHTPAEMERHDENDVGGDINGGIQDIRQLVFRPWPSIDPYRVGEGSTCARRRRRPVVACTGCAASTPRDRRCDTSSARGADYPAPLAALAHPDDGSRVARASPGPSRAAARSRAPGPRRQGRRTRARTAAA
jgi:phytoene dehydrogenase-like protein